MFFMEIGNSSQGVRVVGGLSGVRVAVGLGVIWWWCKGGIW